MVGNDLKTPLNIITDKYRQAKIQKPKMLVGNESYKLEFQPPIGQSVAKYYFI